MSEIEKIMRMAPVIPVLVVDNVADARPMATALVAGGLKVLEVTLRTDAALDVIAEMKKVEGAVVGAGTVCTPRDFELAYEAGAEFIVSPGLTDKVARLVLGRDVPFLPGIATASDIMRGLDMGLNHFKFFPAMANGGIPALKALIGPFGQCKFCPTGGISLSNAPDWLALKQVLCVGGSWVAPKNADADEIEALARQAGELSR